MKSVDTGRDGNGLELGIREILTGKSLTHWIEDDNAFSLLLLSYVIRYWGEIFSG